jgi:hypothetical protein
VLAQDYTKRLEEVIHQVPWDIELPTEWQDFFAERGEVPSFADDDRSNQRLKVRIHGVMWIESTLHFCKRSAAPSGIYTRDFSRQGAGLLCSFELFPEEVIRLALPTFWVQMRVVRTRRLTSKCYEIGTLLVARHDPNMDAFNVCGLLQKAS